MYDATIFEKSNAVFKRLTGVKKQTFKVMTNILNLQYQADHKYGGKPSNRTIEEKLLMTLEYWREYRTYFHIANSYNYSESQTYKTIKWIENTLIKSGVFNIPGKKKLHTLDKESVVLIDVTESPIERPQKKAAQLLFWKEEATHLENASDSE